MPSTDCQKKLIGLPPDQTHVRAQGLNLYDTVSVNEGRNCSKITYMNR